MYLDIHDIVMSRCGEMVDGFYRMGFEERAEDSSCSRCEIENEIE